MTEIPRRNVLRLASTLAAAPALASSPPAGAATSAAVAAPGSAQPFPLGSVQLGDSLFTAKRDLLHEFANAYPADRILSIFRANAGLDTRGAPPVGGWESPDGQARGNLRGHFAGHFMSMLAQIHASTGDRASREKLDYIVHGLGECQRALADYVPAFARGDGRFGRAVRLDGSTEQHAVLPALPLGGQSGSSIAMWANLDNTDEWARLFDFSADEERYCFLTVKGPAGTPRFSITTSGAGNESSLDADAEFPVGRWCHIAVVFEDRTGVLYLDGVQAGRAENMPVTPSDLGTTTQNRIGRSLFAADPYLRGSVDDLHLYDRPLTTDEVAELQRRPGAGTVAAYAFDEADGTAVADGSGHDRHGRLAGQARPSHPGYLAAYPETQFILLESYHTFPAVWAPYYTCHKIMRGLLDAHVLAGNPEALGIADRMGEWVHSRLSRCSPEQLQRMWSIFSAGEFGGMNEVLVDLAAATGRDHVRTAKLFDLNAFIDACARDEDVLDGLHANQHIPMSLGFLGIYGRTGERRYLDAARNLWSMIVEHRTYSLGGNGRSEFWHARDSIAATLHPKNAETCATYNTLKLSRALFFHEQDPKRIDYYERGLYNHVLASRQDARSTEDPLVTYFVGMSPGAVREFGNLGTCCGGTGLENHTKYQDSIYFRSGDASTLYVNLFASSTLDWPDRSLRLVQQTRFPDEQSSTLIFEGRGSLALKIRCPRWTRKGVTVRLNGRAVPVEATPGSYITLDREWRTGDRVEVEVPFSLYAESAIDDRTVQSLFYGPLLIVARDRSSELSPLSLYGSARLSGDLIDAAQPDRSHFRIGEREYAPFHEATTDAYHAYFRRREPAIVFAGLDSGVANPARPDGETLLDELWRRSPFADQNEFVRAVSEVTETWVGEGRCDPAERETIVRTAQRAPMRP